jgi:hypothetical protein
MFDARARMTRPTAESGARKFALRVAVLLALTGTLLLVLATPVIACS